MYTAGKAPTLTYVVIHLQFDGHVTGAEPLQFNFCRPLRVWVWTFNTLEQDLWLYIVVVRVDLVGLVGEFGKADGGSTFRGAQGFLRGPQCWYWGKNIRLNMQDCSTSHKTNSKCWCSRQLACLGYVGIVTEPTMAYAGTMLCLGHQNLNDHNKVSRRQRQQTLSEKSSQKMPRFLWDEIVLYALNITIIWVVVVFLWP